MLQTLSQRELKNKYKSSSLGTMWLLINSLSQALIIFIVFSLFVKIPIENYWLYALSGIVPWTAFSIALTNSTNSIIDNRDLIKKVPFDRMILPISSATGHIMGSILGFIFLVIVSILIVGISYYLLLLVPLIFLLLFLVIGISLTLSSLNAYYRDVIFMLQIALMAWFYLNPIIYSMSIVPGNLQALYILNPMVGIITSFQGILVNPQYFEPMAIIVTMIETIILLISGTVYFNKKSKYFADWI